jgi:hypothetical protein
VVSTTNRTSWAFQSIARGVRASLKNRTVMPSTTMVPASGVLVDVADHRFGPVPMKKGMQGAVGRIAFQVVGDVRQGGACLPPDIDDDFTEVSPSDMMPDAKFADAAKAIDTDFQLSFIHFFCLASGLMGLGSMPFQVSRIFITP